MTDQKYTPQEGTKPTTSSVPPIKTSETADAIEKILMPQAPITPVAPVARADADTTELLQRVQADFENYIKRVDKEKADVKRATTERLLTKLLNTMDDFQRAFEHLKQGCSHDDFVKGMTLVFTHFQKMLSEEGLKEVKASGKVNPYEHEVLLQEENKSVPEGHVLQELQKGYVLNGHLLRSAKVKVSKTNTAVNTASSSLEQNRR